MDIADAICWKILFSSSRNDTGAASGSITYASSVGCGHRRAVVGNISRANPGLRITSSPMYAMTSVTVWSVPFRSSRCPTTANGDDASRTTKGLVRFDSPGVSGTTLVFARNRSVKTDPERPPHVRYGTPTRLHHELSAREPSVLSDLLCAIISPLPSSPSSTGHSSPHVLVSAPSGSAPHDRVISTELDNVTDGEVRTDADSVASREPLTLIGALGVDEGLSTDSVRVSVSVEDTDSVASTERLRLIGALGVDEGLVDGLGLPSLVSVLRDAVIAMLCVAVAVQESPR